MIRSIFFVFALLLCCMSYAQKDDDKAIEQFINLFGKSHYETQLALDYIEDNWRSEYASMAIEVMYLSRNPLVDQQLLDILRSNEKVEFGYDFDKWYRWLWDREENTQISKRSFTDLLIRDSRLILRAGMKIISVWMR
ncbi:hypothetical protein [Ekhidna sp.]